MLKYENYFARFKKGCIFAAYSKGIQKDFEKVGWLVY